MRALSKLMLVAALTLPALAACDKKEESKKDDKAKTDDKAKADEGKAEAKKAGDEVVGANVAGEDPESGCIHGEEKHVEGEGEGCEHGSEAPARDATGHFGNPFALTEAKPLASVLAAGVGTDAVKVSGTVESVCQAKGCWMVIKDGDAQARVLVKDHAFAIPMDGKGKAALVEGTITSKELTQANVDHLKKDGDPNVGDVPKTEFFLEATAVELTNS
ncbi:DUF4920 domain-containing protein [Nannocystaceae bacterium ST9]